MTAHTESRLADNDVVAAVVGGNLDAFSILVVRYEAPLKRYLVRLCRNTAIAEDLSQDAFARAFENIRYYSRRRQFKAWLFRIAHNLWIDKVRKETRHTTPLVDVDDIVDPPNADAIDLERALAAVTETEKSVLLLNHGCGLSHREISYVMDLPLGTVKSHARRGLEKAAKAVRGRVE